MRLRTGLLLTFAPLLAVAPWACGGGDSNDLPDVDASFEGGGGDGNVVKSDGGGGDGSTLACVRASSTGAQRLLDLAVVADSSGSLGVASDAGPPWIQYRNQFLDSLLKNKEAAGIRASMTYFPKGAACDDPTYAAPYVGATDLPSNVFASALAALPAANQSLVLQGLNGGYSIADTMHKATGHELEAVLIVTDGAPITCLPDGGDGGPGGTFGAAQAAAAKGIPTYVVLVPDATGLPSYGDPLAVAGGTAKSLSIDVANPQASATAVLNAIRSNMGTLMSCSIPAPSDLGDGGPPVPPTRLTVYVTPEGGTRAVLPYVASCTAPDAGPPPDAAADAAPVDAGPPAPITGWTMNGSNVELCKASCEPLARQRAARVEIGVDCN